MAKHDKTPPARHVNRSGVPTKKEYTDPADEPRSEATREAAAKNLHSSDWPKNDPDKR